MIASFLCCTVQGPGQINMPFTGWQTCVRARKQSTCEMPITLSGLQRTSKGPRCRLRFASEEALEKFCADNGLGERHMWQIQSHQHPFIGWCHMAQCCHRVIWRSRTLRFRRRPRGLLTSKERTRADPPESHAPPRRRKGAMKRIHVLSEGVARLP